MACKYCSHLTKNLHWNQLATFLMPSSGFCFDFFPILFSLSVNILEIVFESLFQIDLLSAVLSVNSFVCCEWWGRLMGGGFSHALQFWSENWFSRNPSPGETHLPWVQEEYLWEDSELALWGCYRCPQCSAMFCVLSFWRCHQLSSSPPDHEASSFMLRNPWGPAPFYLERGWP